MTSGGDGNPAKATKVRGVCAWCVVVVVVGVGVGVVMSCGLGPSLDCPSLFQNWRSGHGMGTCAMALSVAHTSVCSAPSS